jgi:hypothetical protein
MSNQEIEHRMQIAQDTKKEFKYIKDSGLWHWINKGDDDNHSKGFTTFLSCLTDATDPYFLESD